MGIDDLKKYADKAKDAVSDNRDKIEGVADGAIDKMGVAVRTGHHCAEPVMTRFGIPGTVRASFALYNTMEEVEIFVKAVKKAAMMLR